MKTTRAFVTALLFVVAAGSDALAQQRSDDSRAWMGLYIRDIDAADIRALDLRDGTRGLVVSGVDDDGPAAKAGVEPGDVITAFEGRTVENRDRFLELLAERQPGDSIRLKVLRDGDTRTVEFDLERRPRELEGRRWLEPRRSPQRLRRGGPRLGVQTLDLESAELAAYFGVDSGDGVLVTAVVDESGAAAAGLLAGDVILAVAGNEIGSTHDLRAEVDRHDPGDQIQLRIRRQRRDQTVDVELGESDELRRFGLRLPFQSGRISDGDLQELRREFRDLRRELRDLEREMRSLRGR